MPAPATVLHSNDTRTALAGLIKSRVETGGGTMTAEIYDDADVLLVAFDIATFSAVSAFGFSADESPKPEATSEAFGAGTKTPTYAIIKSKGGVETWRTPSVTTTPASFAASVPVRLNTLSYTASV
jgi:hypothetical protein